MREGVSLLGLILPTIIMLVPVNGGTEPF